MKKFCLLLVTLLAANLAVAQRSRWVGFGNAADNTIKCAGKAAGEMTPNIERGLLRIIQDSADIGDQLIIKAIKDNNIDLLNYLRWNTDYRRVLKLALPESSVLRQLFDGGAVVTDLDLYYEAAQKGYQQSVNLLCERFKPTAGVKHEMLLEAVDHNQFAVAQDLLDKFHVDINAQLPGNDILLLRVGRYFAPSHTDKMKFALDNGANPNLVVPATGNSVYYQLFLEGRYDDLPLMRQYGAKLEGKMLENVNLQLHDAIDNPALTRQLLEMGANPYFKKDGMTPLERAKAELEEQQSAQSDYAKTSRLQAVVDIYKNIGK